MNKYKDFLFDSYHKVFTVEHPKNTFKIDYSNGYPVKVTTNVTKNTSWKDILCGNYKLVNPDGTPEYLLVNGKKYTYIDYKWANERGYRFNSSSGYDIQPYRMNGKVEKFFRKKIYHVE